MDSNGIGFYHNFSNGVEPLGWSPPCRLVGQPWGSTSAGLEPRSRHHLDYSHPKNPFVYPFWKGLTRSISLFGWDWKPLNVTTWNGDGVYYLGIPGVFFSKTNSVFFFYSILGSENTPIGSINMVNVPTLTRRNQHKYTLHYIDPLGNWFYG